MGLAETLYFINMIVFAIGFSMPAVAHFGLKRTNSLKERGGIGWMQAFVWWFLRSFLQVIKSDYDEAVRRTWDDRVKGWYPKISKALIMAPLLAMYGFVFLAPLFNAPSFDSRLHRYFLVALTAESMVVYHRMKHGFDEDEEFTHFGRNFYMYYPFFDERTDLARSQALYKTSTTLKGKGNALQSKFKANLTNSLFHVAAWLAYVSLVILKGTFGNLVWYEKLFFAVPPLYMTMSNRAGTAFLDALQQYVFMAATRLPIKSFKSQSVSLAGTDIVTWANNTVPGSKLLKPHYNLVNSYFPPLSGFIHGKVYKPLRTDYNLSIADAMLVTTLARGALFVGTFAFLETWKEPEIELVGFAAYYVLTAIYLKRRDELGLGPLGFGAEKLGRKKEVQDAEWTFFKIFHTITETACVTVPLLTHICSNYGVDPSTKGSEVGN